MEIAFKGVRESQHARGESPYPSITKGGGAHMRRSGTKREISQEEAGKKNVEGQVVRAAGQSREARESIKGRKLPTAPFLSDLLLLPTPWIHGGSNSRTTFYTSLLRLRRVASATQTYGRLNFGWARLCD